MHLLPRSFLVFYLKINDLMYITLCKRTGLILHAYGRFMETYINILYFYVSTSRPLRSIWYVIVLHMVYSSCIIYGRFIDVIKYFIFLCL